MAFLKDLILFGSLALILTENVQAGWGGNRHPLSNKLHPSWRGYDRLVRPIGAGNYFVTVF